MQTKYVQSYERLERDHWWWQARRRILLSLLQEKFSGPRIRPSLLDVGCGAGLNLSALEEHFHCTGVEPDPFLASQARQNSHSEIIESGLPLKADLFQGSFDCILLLDVLEHIDDDVSALRSAASYLSPNGYILINVPAFQWLWSVHDVVNQHRRRYSGLQLREMIEKAGLKVIFLRYWCIWTVPALAISRKLYQKPIDPDNYSVYIPPRFVNRIMGNLIRLEFQINKVARIPMGSSMLAIAQACPP